MFQKGEFIVHGKRGVCKVLEIGSLEGLGMPKEKMYYTLVPLGDEKSRVYAPIEEGKIKIRAVVSKEEAQSVIDSIDELEDLEIVDEKSREMAYKQALGQCDCKDLIRIIKTIYQRKKVRMESGKKVTNSDEKYFQMAEDYLYEEFSIALDMEKEQVQSYIASCMGEKELA